MFLSSPLFLLFCFIFIGVLFSFHRAFLSPFCGAAAVAVDVVPRAAGLLLSINDDSGPSLQLLGGSPQRHL